MVKMVNPTPCSKGQAMATSRNNGIQDHLPCALQSCAALEHPGCHLKNVPHGGLCLGSGDSVCQPGSTAGTGVGVCVILPVLASPLQPQRTQVPCPAPGTRDTGSPRERGDGGTLGRTLAWGCIARPEGAHACETWAQVCCSLGSCSSAGTPVVNARGGGFVPWALNSVQHVAITLGRAEASCATLCCRTSPALHPSACTFHCSTCQHLHRGAKRTLSSCTSQTVWDTT